MLLSSPAALLPLLFAPQPAPLHSRVFGARMATDVTQLEVIDREDDVLLFRTASEGLALDVDGQPHCPSIKSIEYDIVDGVVVTEGATGAERGQFTFRHDRQLQEAETLKLLAVQTGVEFRELETPLPEAIEALLIDDDLKASRPGVRILYNRILDIYPSEEAALEAIGRNSALVLPYLNKPFHIDGSWVVLKQMMSEAEALEVVTKNPGLLTCNPIGLKGASADDVKRAALVVDTVEALPLGARWGLVAAVTLGVTSIIAGGEGGLFSQFQGFSATGFQPF